MNIQYVFALTLFVSAYTFSEVEKSSAINKTVSILDVFSSTLQHHPQILAAQAQLDQAKARQLASQGAFDWQIDHSSQARTSGFYDGYYADQSIGRQLPWANAKISAGYRREEGSEHPFDTLSDGEANLKFSIALLKDRAIDSNRNALRQANIGYDLAEIDYSLGMNVLLLEAGFSYLSWHQACHEVEIVKELLSLATSRRTAITAQVESGDMANIVLTEFDTTLLNRRLAVLERVQAGEVAGKNLSMFLRNENGQPVTLSLENCHYQKHQITSSVGENDLANLGNHPILARISGEIAQIDNELRLAKNSILPELDLEVSLSEDIGSGSETLEGFESYVGVKFSVPLERRKEKGKISETNAKLRELQQKRQQLLDMLRIDIEATLIQLENVKHQYKAQQKRAALTTRLAEQELLRFNAGDSDLFLLNTRERAIGVARLSLIKLETDLVRLKINLLAKFAQLDASAQKAIDDASYSN